MSGTFKDALFSAALLEGADLFTDPLALLPLSLSFERRTRVRFDWRRYADGATALSALCLPPHRPSASRRARVPFLFGRCAANFSR